MHDCVSEYPISDFIGKPDENKFPISARPKVLERLQENTNWPGPQRAQKAALYHQYKFRLFNKSLTIDFSLHSF